MRVKAKHIRQGDIIWYAHQEYTVLVNVVGTEDANLVCRREDPNHIYVLEPEPDCLLEVKAMEHNLQLTTVGVENPF